MDASSAGEDEGALGEGGAGASGAGDVVGIGGVEGGDYVTAPTLDGGG